MALDDSIGQTVTPNIPPWIPDHKLYTHTGAFVGGGAWRCDAKVCLVCTPLCRARKLQKSRYNVFRTPDTRLLKHGHVPYVQQHNTHALSSWSSLDTPCCNSRRFRNRLRVLGPQLWQECFWSHSAFVGVAMFCIRAVFVDKSHID